MAILITLMTRGFESARQFPAEQTRKELTKLGRFRKRLVFGLLFTIIRERGYPCID
jgi:hypothetical protein